MGSVPACVAAQPWPYPATLWGAAQYPFLGHRWESSAPLRKPPRGPPEQKQSFLVPFCGLAPSCFLDISHLLHGCPQPECHPNVAYPPSPLGFCPYRAPPLGMPAGSPLHRPPVPNANQPSMPKALSTRPSLICPTAKGVLPAWIQEHLVCAACLVLRTPLS